MESDYHWLITIGLVTSSVIAVTANFFLLVVFCRRRGLRTVPNRFVINLLITNLLSSILLIPLLLVDQEASSSSPTASASVAENVIVNNSIKEIRIEEEIHSDPTTNTIQIIETDDIVAFLPQHANINTNTNDLLCYFAHSTTTFVCTASIFSILLIGINQYFGVIHSLRYHFYINKCRSSIFIGISWFVALLCSVLSSLTYTDSGVWHFCQDRTQPSDALRILNTFYAFGYFILVILAPFIAICVIYVCIYTAAHQNSERMRRSASAPLNPHMDYIQVPLPTKESSHQIRDMLPKVHSAPNFSIIETDHREYKVIDSACEPTAIVQVSRTPSERSSSNSFITNLRHKISNASVFKYREETRAAKISVLVIFMVLVCYVPYGVTLILSSKCIDVKTSQIFNYLSLILLVFSNIISPFLFGYRNKRVKREICKLFGAKQKLTAPTAAVGAGTCGERSRKPSHMRNNASFEDVRETFEEQQQDEVVDRPFVPSSCRQLSSGAGVPEVIVTCKQDNERKSILKRVCNTSNWPSYKKCNFITVPDSCISGEARGSFSSASTQISTED